jgi:hypothetical protein
VKCGEKSEVLAAKVGAILLEEVELVWCYADVLELFTVLASAYGV